MINGTFFVQIINFFFGYVILKYLFLRPGLRIIQGQQIRLLELNKSIVALRKDIAGQQGEQEDVWRKLYKKIYARKPHITGAVSCHTDFFVETPVEIGPQEEQELIEHIKNAILDQVIRE